MTSRRVQKVAEAIREVVSMAILADLNDPRVRDVTVTYVEVSADLRQAKIHVSVMGDEAKQKLSLHGLTSAAGFLQSRVSNRIELRYTPRLAFVLDHGIKKSLEISRILQEVLPEPSGADEEGADAGDLAPSRIGNAVDVETARRADTAGPTSRADPPADADRTTTDTDKPMSS